MRKFALALLLLAIVAGIASVLGYKRGFGAATGRIEERVDTLLIVDTIAVSKPVYLTRFVTDTLIIERTDTLQVRDTLFFEVKTYGDSTYFAQVSGWNCALDSIAVFPRTQIITRERTITQPVKHWGFGGAAGLTMLPCDGVMCFGIGVTAGLVYRF